METDPGSFAFGATIPNYTFDKDTQPNAWDITDVDMDKYRALCVDMVRYYGPKEV